MLGHRGGPLVSLARSDLDDRGAFEDVHAERLDRGGQAADELGRLDARGVRAERLGHRAVHAQPRLVVGSQQVVVLGPVPPLLQVGDLLQEAGLLRLVGRHDAHAALDDVGVDPLGLGHPDDLVDRGHHGALERDHRSLAVRLGVAFPRPGELGRQPAAVAARRAEARELPFQDRHAQVGLFLLEVVGGPQAGVSGADDAHVVVGIAGQGGTAFGNSQFAVPEGHPAVAELLRAGNGAHLGRAGDESHVCLPPPDAPRWRLRPRFRRTSCRTWSPKLAEGGCGEEDAFR